jgi:hypothetical protein
MKVFTPEKVNECVLQGLDGGCRYDV